MDAPVLLARFDQRAPRAGCRSLRDMRIADVPSLSIEGLCLRPLEQSDAEAWYEYVAMPDVASETTWNLQSVDDIRPLIAWYNSEDPASGIRFAIASPATNRLVGTIGFHTISVPNRTAE